MDLSLIVAALLIALLGLPHGALDPVVAYRAGLWQRPLGLLAFLCVYLVLCGAMLALWWRFPLIGFLVFFIISALHFGRDYYRYKKNSAQQIAYGAFVLGLPTLFHPADTQQIFSYLLFGETPVAILWLLQIGGIAGALCLVLGLKGTPIKASIELAGLVFTAWLLSPLWYFVLFFCFLHSPRHLLPLYQDINTEQRQKSVTTMLVITLLTLLAAVVIAWYLSVSALSLDSLVLQIIFIGLAGLTVPHMILIEYSRRHHKNNSNLVTPREI